MTGTTRRPRGLALALPAGFIELTRDGQPRTEHFERELAEAYPELARLERERVLALLAQPDVTARLRDAPDTHRVALGVVRSDEGLAGIVVLAAAEMPLPAGASAGTLADSLRTAVHGRTDIEVESLPASGGAAVLVRHPVRYSYLEQGVLERSERFPERRADLYLASPHSGALVVVSSSSVGAAERAVTGLLAGIAAGARPV